MFIAKRLQLVMNLRLRSVHSWLPSKFIYVIGCRVARKYEYAKYRIPIEATERWVSHGYIWSPPPSPTFPFERSILEGALRILTKAPHTSHVYSMRTWRRELGDRQRYLQEQTKPHYSTPLDHLQSQVLLLTMYVSLLLDSLLPIISGRPTERILSNLTSPQLIHLLSTPITVNEHSITIDPTPPAELWNRNIPFATHNF